MCMVSARDTCRDPKGWSPGARVTCGGRRSAMSAVSDAGPLPTVAAIMYPLWLRKYTNLLWFDLEVHRISLLLIEAELRHPVYPPPSKSYDASRNGYARV